jgi:AraC-like DNA-binding protein
MIFYESKSDHVYCWHGNDITFPPHIHKELELLMVTKGQIELTTNSSIQLLRQGDLSVMFPNTIHSYRTINDSEYLILIFNGDMLPLYKNIFSSQKPSNNFIPVSQVPSEVYNSFCSIQQEVQLDNNSAIITGYLYLIIGRLLSLMSLQKTQIDIGFNLQERILSYIQLNYLNPINLSLIANEFGISRFYLSRFFSHNIGIRLDKYINELRVNYANYLLSSSNKQITEIAFECGFETLRTFNRAYKSITSVTPREYRKQLGFSTLSDINKT